MTPKEARRADRFTQFAVAAAEQAAAEAGLPDGDRARAPRRRSSAPASAGCTTLEARVPNVAGGRRARGLAALRADDDAQRRRRPDRHAPGRPRAGLLRRLGVRDRRHAIGEALRMIAARRRRRRRRRRHRGGADRRCAWPPSSAWARCRARASRARSTPAATASSWARAPACSCSSARSTRGRAARRSSARVAGYGASNDAFHITQPDEDGRGADRRRCAAALADAGAAPGDVGYVNAHGTSTPFNDRIETPRDQAASSTAAAPPVVARRSRRSGTCSAPPARSRRSPALEARARAACCRRRSTSSEPDPECDLDYVPDGPREAPGPGARAVQLVRLRRPERVPRGGGRRERDDAPSSTSPAGRASGAPRRPRAARAALRPRHASGRCAARSATACSPAAGASTAAPVCAWAQDGAHKGGSLGARGGETIARTIERADGARRARSSASRTPAARGCRRASRRWPPTPRSSARRSLARRAADQRRRRARARAARPTRRRSATSTSWPATGARMFLTGPASSRRSRARTSRAAELGGPRVHGRNGVSHLVADDDVARRRARPRTRSRTCPRTPAAPLPLHAAARPAARRPGRRRCPTRPRQVYDVRDVAARLVDGGELLELAPRWARNLVVGLARIDGAPVGVIANQPRHLGGCARRRRVEKGAWFVDLCDRFGIPLVVLVDTPGLPARASRRSRPASSATAPRCCAPSRAPRSRASP